MLIAGLNAPTMANHGDFWFCYATRDLYEYQVSTQGLGNGTWHLVGAGRYVSTNPPPVATNTGRPADPIWIMTNDPDRIPHIYDHTGTGFWIPVVKKGFSLPPISPVLGNGWVDMNTLDGYMFDGTRWVINMPAATLQISQAQQNTTLMKVMPPPSPTTLTIYGPGGTPLVEILRDGTIKYGPSYNPDDAAKIFWTALSQASTVVKDHELFELREKIKYAEDRGFKFPKPQKPVDPNDAWDAAMGVIG